MKDKTNSLIGKTVTIPSSLTNLIVLGTITYNPFCREIEQLGFLYKNPRNGNLTWSMIFPHELEELHKQNEKKE